MRKNDGEKSGQYRIQEGRQNRIRESRQNRAQIQIKKGYGAACRRTAAALLAAVMLAALLGGCGAAGGRSTAETAAATEAAASTAAETAAATTAAAATTTETAAASATEKEVLAFGVEEGIEAPAAAEEGAEAAPAEAGGEAGEAPLAAPAEAGAAAPGPEAAAGGAAEIPFNSMADTDSAADMARSASMKMAAAQSGMAAPQNGMAMSQSEMAMPRNGIARKYRDAYGNPESGSFNTEEYGYISENDYKPVATEPLSTFSVDVDTASYGNVRRMIRNGQEIPPDAVRIEEMINYFDYDYPEPKGNDPFSVTTEYSDCPWKEGNRLLMIGLQAKEIDFSDRPASNFVFLLDVSGSMYSDDKLPLVQKAFAMLTENLTEADRVSIVTYAGYESVVLDGVSGEEKARIQAALEDLEAGGSTAGAAGIQKAYELARKHYIPGGNNRVILATDGDLNVGITSESQLTRLIQEERKSGVHLSVLGVGTGNIKDNKMEALADNGDGNYNYLDSLFEAKKVLVDEMGGTLVTVAKDVKIQVEFNPEYVSAYRLIGYENRLLDNEDFANDKVDAGEIGSGHTVTALYEIVPADGASAGGKLRYQTAGKPVGSSELLTVSLRYKAPNGDRSKLMECPVEADIYRKKPSENLAFAAAVAEFGMVLRDSENKGNASYENVMALAEDCVHADTDGYRKEFLELVEQASAQAEQQ